MAARTADNVPAGPVRCNMRTSLLQRLLVVPQEQEFPLEKTEPHKELKIVKSFV